VGIYSLVVLIVVMLAAIVVTQEPNEDSELTKAPRKKRVSGFVSPRPGNPLATTAGSSQK
jgi:ABC-type oligopeptide transport system substrate-binding subunit